MKAWWKREGSELYGWCTEQTRYKARRSYLSAFGLGASSRILDERQVAVSETTGAELVLHDEMEQVQAHAHKAHEKVTSGKRLPMDQTAGIEGFHAGQKANVGTAAISA